MLGLFRYVLALMVAISHLWPGHLGMGGAYAVFCFYLVSGYLMSFILSEVYARPADVRFYVANRVLRIFPPYLCVAFLCFVTLAAFPSLMEARMGSGLMLSSVMKMPASVTDWLGNISLLWPWDSGLLVGQAWSLRVELVFYGLMVLLARSRTVVVIWFLASLAYTVYQHALGAPFFERYTTVLGSSIAFALGAMIYQFASHVRLGGKHLFLSAALYLVHVFLAPELWQGTVDPADTAAGYMMLVAPKTYGLYVNLALGAYVLLAILSQQKEGGELFRFGKKMGDVAYAIFLSHWFVAMLVLLVGVPVENELQFFAITMILLHIVSYVIYRLVEEPVNKHLRDKIRSNVSA